MKLRPLYLFAVSVACSSCVVPIPHRRVHVVGVTGLVVSADSGQPISTATVVAGNVREPARTDKDGKFTIQPIMGWHGARFVGPISLSLLPAFDLPEYVWDLRVSAPGFQAKSFVVPRGRGFNLDEKFRKAGVLRLNPDK